MNSINRCFTGLLIWCAILFLSACSGFKQINENRAPVIKVMSYNIHHGNPPGDEGRIDMAAIIQTIREEDPDIVALQEVDVQVRRSGKIDQAAILAKALNMQFLFSKAIDFDGGEYGLVILSKHRLSSKKVHKLSMAADSTAEPRILQSVIVHMPNSVPFVFANTHLDVLNTGNRLLQAKEIVGLAKQEKLPMILAGDWNAAPGSPTLAIFEQAFAKTCTQCPVTCPEEGLEGAIDFIAYTRNSHFKTREHRVLNNNKSSDHYPVIAEIISK